MCFAHEHNHDGTDQIISQFPEKHATWRDCSTEYLGSPSVPVYIVIALTLSCLLHHSNGATVTNTHHSNGVTVANTHHVTPKPTHKPVHHVNHRPTTPTTTMDPMDVQLGGARQTLEGLARQLVMQQLGVEERIRSDGDSGIKQSMLRHKGTRPYLNDDVTRFPAVFYDLPYNRDQHIINTNIFVLNGVEFKIPSQRYKLVMPSKNSHDWHKTEPIPYPRVPPSVLAKHNVSDQIAEMQQYFRAFKYQDTKIRSDYADYFKPVLCYLEGTWLDGAAHDQRRWMSEALSIEFLSADGLETGQTFNPTKIMTVTNGTALYAHWNARIVCHPIQQELKLASFYIKDDLATRLSFKKSLYDFAKSKSARFDLIEFGRRPRGFLADLGHGEGLPTFSHYSTLDAIMEEIPGKDNYPVNITGGEFGLTTYNAHFPRNNTKLNIGKYHHWYRVLQKGAMGTTVINRGYADRTLWVAANTQHNVAALSYRSCHRDRTTHKNVCTADTARYSYAIPLEIIWLTPLLTWNPYNLAYIAGDVHKNPANTITANGRDGHTPEKALNGTNMGNFFQTPAEFFSHASGRRYVMDRTGHTHSVVPSGTETVLRDIPAVGTVRLRYPVVPTHYEGNVIYKELDALKDLVMNMATNAKYFREKPTALQSIANPTRHEEHYQTSSSSAVSQAGLHKHDVFLSQDDVAALIKGQTVAVYTTLNNGHQHVLEIYLYARGHTSHTNLLRVSLCDGKVQCGDGHSNILYYKR
ncbi:uncharacterized protein LOC132556152 [Ylistrum balloti]|uniref:uncharacterized protein LOC132556152 n=1 Tax=Ylistrum balloti TaxID=509963 RepID=UPI002905D6F4|nr:uncharacterized protein LOC132556152 [Ylistrum balloti]